MAGNTNFKGVYCLECEWYDKPRSRHSIEHILRIVDLINSPKHDHIHYDVSTSEEFWFLLNRWTLKKYSSHPILYLGFHGEPGKIYLRAGANSPVVTVQDLRKNLAGKCDKRVIIFGSCETMHAKTWSPTRFLLETQALAICGYDRPIDWMQSAAMDLIVLSSMQSNALTVSGIRAIAKRIRQTARGLCKDLGFRIYTQKGEV